MTVRKSIKVSTVSLLLAVILVTPFVFLTYPKTASACNFAGALKSALTNAGSQATGQASGAVAVPVTDRGLSTIVQGVLRQDTLAAGNLGELVTKECLLDLIVNILGKTILRMMTDAIVEWINSGFKGSPTFVQNPAEFLTEFGDIVGGQLLDAIGLCDELNWNLKAKLRLHKQSKPYSGCRITDVIENYQGFLEGDFVEAGWDGWFSVTQNGQNNSFGMYINGHNQLEKVEAAAQGEEKNKLDWGQGFHSIVDSTNKILTPGNTIQTQLNTSLGSGFRTIEVADEINEIIGALVGQLIKQVMTGGDSGGLANASGSRGGGFNTPNSDNIAEDNGLVNPLDDFDPSENTDYGTGGGRVPIIGQPKSVAKGGATDQITTNLPASKAVDGQRDGEIKDSYAQTKNDDPDPWWQVNLGALYSVNKVDIYRRTKGMSPEEAIGDFIVYVSPNEFPSTTFGPGNPPPADTWMSNKYTFGGQVPFEISVPNHMGQYVRVQRVTLGVKEKLALAEVEVFISPPVITLRGNSSETIPVCVTQPCDAYNDPGVDVTDPTYGAYDADNTNLNVVTTYTKNNVDVDSINTRQTGTYVITYTAINAGGSSATASRTVIVQ